MSDATSNLENKPPKSPRVALGLEVAMFTLYTGTVLKDFVPLLKMEAARLCLIHKDFYGSSFPLALFSGDLWSRHHSPP